MATSSHIADVSRSDFNSLVIEKSRQLPVLVDFWAPWCGPCRMLTPILERLAGEYAGKLFVAKVNTDVEQELAGEYRIRGIPAVKLFRNGEIAGEFVGVQPEPAIRALIDRFVPGEMDALIDKAVALGKTGQTTEAATLLRETLGQEPNNDRAKLALVQVLCGSARPEDARAHVEECQKLLDSLSVRSAGNPDVEQARFRLSLLRSATDAPSPAALERAISTDPDDLRSRYRLAAHLALAGEYEPAMEQLLEVVRRNPAFDDGAGRKALIGMFQLLGSQHPLTVKYRSLLSRVLY